MRWSTLSLAVSALILGMAPCLHGAVIPLDDFSAMDPTLPGWTKVDLSDGQPWGPGDYDPSSGALRISHSGTALVPPGVGFDTTAMFALWNDSADPLYSQGQVRAKIRTNQVQNSTGVGMRVDLGTATGYLLFGFTRPPASMPELDSTFLMSKFVNGVETNIWESGIEYLPGEDWNVEVVQSGARITAKVWRAGDLEPSEPLFDWIDPDPIAGGMIAISSDKTKGNTIDARGDGTFDDIVFYSVPEPQSLLLLAVGTLAMFIYRRT